MKALVKINFHIPTVLILFYKYIDMIDAFFTDGSILCLFHPRLLKVYPLIQTFLLSLVYI